MNKKKERTLSVKESKKLISRLLTIFYIFILLIFFINNGINVDTSVDASAGVGFSIKLDNREMPIMYYMIFLPMVGFFLRKVFRKTKENEMFAIEAVLGFFFLFPITIIIVMSSLIYLYACMIYLIVLAVIYLIFNIFRRKSITFYLKYEYILFIIFLLIFVINSYI